LRAGGAARGGFRVPQHSGRRETGTVETEWTCADDGARGGAAMEMRTGFAPLVGVTYIVALAGLAAWTGTCAAPKNPGTLGPVSDTVCLGVDKDTCLEQTTYAVQEWEYRELRKWARAVSVADWDTISSKGGNPKGCNLDAATVKKARNGVINAFRSNWRDDLGLVSEWFYWGNMRNRNELGFHFADSVRFEHAIISDRSGEQDIWETLVHEGAHHGGVNSHEDAEAVIDCVTRREDRERRGGGGADPIDPDDPWGPIDPGMTLECHDEAAWGKTCIDVMWRRGDGCAESPVGPVCDEDGKDEDGWYEVQVCEIESSHWREVCTPG